MLSSEVLVVPFRHGTNPTHEELALTGVAEPPVLDVPTELIGERILVRSWREADAPLLFEAVDDSRARLREWMTWVDAHDSLAVSEEYCRRMPELWTSGRGFPTGIWHRESGQLLGGSGLLELDWGIPAAEIGYWLRNDAVGHGYVEEAVRLQLDFAFDDLGLLRVRLTCDPDNARSRRIPEALGFTLEGHLRRDVRMPNGDLRDTLVYSVLAEEWRALRSARPD